MSTSTNQLVARARRIALPAGIAAATAVLASAFAIHSNNVHASAVSAAPLDDQSVSALTSMDNAMENLAARVTPAIVNVAVTSRGGEEQQVQMQGVDPQDLPPGFSQFFGQGNGHGGRRMAPEQQPLQASDVNGPRPPCWPDTRPHPDPRGFSAVGVVRSRIATTPLA